DSLHTISGEINSRAVLCRVCVTGGVDEVTGLRAVVPLTTRARDALYIRLIENDAAFRDDSVLRFVNGDLIGLESISADARVDVTFIMKDARVLRTRHALPCRFNAELDGGRVGHRIRDFPIDRIRLLREYTRVGKCNK